MGQYPGLFYINRRRYHFFFDSNLDDNEDAFCNYSTCTWVTSLLAPSAARLFIHSIVGLQHRIIAIVIPFH
jgi:hypothetical protein